MAAAVTVHTLPDRLPRTWLLCFREVSVLLGDPHRLRFLRVVLVLITHGVRGELQVWCLKPGQAERCHACCLAISAPAPPSRPTLRPAMPSLQLLLSSPSSYSGLPLSFFLSRSSSLVLLMSRSRTSSSAPLGWSFAGVADRSSTRDGQWGVGRGAKTGRD